jgi:hypothetical protein
MENRLKAAFAKFGKKRFTNLGEVLDHLLQVLLALK